MDFIYFDNILFKKEDLTRCKRKTDTIFIYFKDNVDNFTCKFDSEKEAKTAMHDLNIQLNTSD